MVLNLTVHLLRDFFDDHSLPVRNVESALLFVQVFVLKVFQERVQALVVIASHRVVVENSCKDQLGL